MTETFTIPEFAKSIVDAVLENGISDPELLLIKVTACLQRRMDQTLVPKNYRIYEGKKNKAGLKREIERQEYEKRFFRDVLKSMVPDMQVYYDELNRILEEKGLRYPFKTTSQYKCFYCERKVDGGQFGGHMGVYITMDHVIPKSKFGKDHAGNIVNACNECNFLKSDLLLPQFIKRLEKMQLKNIEHPGIPISLYRIMIKNATKLMKKQNDQLHIQRRQPNI